MLYRVLPLLVALGGCTGNIIPKLFGDVCLTDDDCARELVCAADAVCRAEGDIGTADVGDACGFLPDCRFGLVCDGAEQCAEPGTPGTAGPGDSCTEGTDCRVGFTCEDDQCYGFDMPAWSGASCGDPVENLLAEEQPFAVLFELGDAVPADRWFSLPFPNDALRFSDGGLDLEGFPRPGEQIPEFGDVVGDIIRTAETTLEGFSGQQAVIFRFSAGLDHSSVVIGAPGTGAVSIVDITPEVPTRGDEHPLQWSATPARSPYACEHRLLLAPLPGRPFLPGHTYAALLTRTLSGTSGQSPVPRADFSAMLADSPPSSVRGERAWNAYAPLRTWLADSGSSPAALAGGTVFTIADSVAPVATLRSAVEAQPTPSLVGAILCGGGSDPYASADDPSRGCQPAIPGALQVQAQLSLPLWQGGTLPFKDFVDGGDIALGGDPEPTGSASATVALTVPEGEAPAEGWPLVIYAHGSEGGYTSHLTNGIAEALSQVALEGVDVRFAVLGFDAHLTGPRAGKSQWKAEWLARDPRAYAPELLFTNPLNVRATRGNGMQVVADLWMLTRLVEELDWSASASPTGSAVRFDPANIYVVGHTWSASALPTYAAHEPGAAAVVMAGASGLTLETMLNRTSPTDLGTLTRLALTDPQADRYHPVLSLFQALVDPLDPVNTAGALWTTPPDGIPARSALQIYGVGDKIAPDESQYALARALRAGQVPGSSTPLEGLTTVVLPASQNVGTGQTVVVSLHQGGARDAHFALMDSSDALAHLTSFLATAVADGVPTVEGL